MTSTEYYDAIASGYDELHKDEQIKKIGIIIEELNKKIGFEKQDNTSRTDDVLIDVGCGTGFSLDLFTRKTPFRCVGVEPSTIMVEQYSGREELFVAPAECLPFPDDFASACVSITAIQNFDDVSKAVQEMIRVSKKAAPIIISCLKKSSRLGEIAEILADALIVEEALEEEKDIIFVCKNNKLCLSQEE